MKWNKKGIAVKELAPVDYKVELLKDPRARTTVLLWLFCGYTQKRAFEVGFSWHGSSNSLPVASTNFFRTQAVELYIITLRERYEVQPYINLRAYRY